MDCYILQDKNVIQENDVLAWAEWLETADRVVMKTLVADDVEVSTVFLGLDHSFGGGRPLLFETMIFGGERDGDQERYLTWDDALVGHKAVVRELLLDGGALQKIRRFIHRIKKGEL